MTPQEKANELVDKMYKVHSSSASNITKLAKYAPYIMIKNHPLGDKGKVETTQYWKQVKDEVNKL